MTGEIIYPIEVASRLADERHALMALARRAAEAPTGFRAASLAADAKALVNHIDKRRAA
jgi:hypothetical protein